LKRIFLLKQGKDLYWKTKGAENLQVFPARITCRYEQKENENIKGKDVGIQAKNKQ
jgi:hypothetical protein